MRGDFKPFMRKKNYIWNHFFPLVFPRDLGNLKSFDIGLREVGAKGRLNRVNKWRKKSVKKEFCRGDFRPFVSKNIQIWDPFYPLLFPKSSESLKILDIWFWEVGAKRRLNGTLKVNKWKKICKKLFTQRKIWTIFEQQFSNLRPLLSTTFPQGFWLREVGEKRRLNRTSKSEHTTTQTHRRRFWLIESIGPEGRCFENEVSECKSHDWITVSTKT